MEEWAEGLVLICNVSKSDIAEIIEDVDYCAKGEKEYLREHFASAVYALIARHGYMNGKYRSYEQLMDKMTTYFKAHDNTDYIDLKFGNRFKEIGLILLKSKITKEMMKNVSSI